MEVSHSSLTTDFNFHAGAQKGLDTAQYWDLVFWKTINQMVKFTQC